MRRGRRVMQPAGHHLAEFNFGILRHDWDDPRVAEFTDAVEAVNAIAKRSPGFVWMLGEDDMDAAQNDPDGALGGNPRMASTLSVWENAGKLRHFVFQTLHNHYYRRGPTWFDPATGGNLVLWWVPIGHRPDVSEAMARFRHWQIHGNQEFAFGWDHLTDQNKWARAPHQTT
ncbi:MAG: DUF3291 domain-containing protein [Pseudomonadota bacterium]